MAVRWGGQSLGLYDWAWSDQKMVLRDAGTPLEVGYPASSQPRHQNPRLVVHISPLVLQIQEFVLTICCTLLYVIGSEVYAASQVWQLQLVVGLWVESEGGGFTA